MGTINFLSLKSLDIQRPGGIMCDHLLFHNCTGGTGSPRLFRARRRYGRRTLPDSSEGEGTLSQRYNRRTLPDSSEGEGTMGTADFSEYSAFSASRTRSSHGQTTSSRVSSFDVEEEASNQTYSGLYVNFFYNLSLRTSIAIFYLS